MYDFIYTTFPVFDLKIKLTKESIIGVEFLQKVPTISNIIDTANPLVNKIIIQLDSYLENGKFKFNLPLTITGTAFQQKICQQLLAIPAGSTLSYKDIAQRIASSPRAVGNGCGRNKIALFIPCHRVISNSGGLGGFMHARNGHSLAIKQWLLEHECVH